MKQLSVVIWLETTDAQIDLIESGIRNFIKGLKPDAQINVIKKEFNINQAREDKPNTRGETT
jgi:hypothetical protein